MDTRTRAELDVRRLMDEAITERNARMTTSPFTHKAREGTLPGKALARLYTDERTLVEREDRNDLLRRTLPPVDTQYEATREEHDRELDIIREGILDWPVVVR